MTIERRHACPSLAVPMRTGDGFLARLPPQTRALAPSQLAAIATAARRHGNGLVEISKRGNLQLRGLGSPDAMALAAELDAVGLALDEGVPVSSDPLFEGDLAERFVAALHLHLAENGVAARLAPKVSVVLDLGTAAAPLGIAADLRLALRGDRVHLGLGGTHERAHWIGTVPPDEAASAAAAILAVLADRGPAARLAGDGGDPADPRFASAGGAVASAPPAAAAPIATVGPIPGLGWKVHGIAFPFGQAGADELEALALAGERAGLDRLAPAAERSLLLAGGDDAIAATVAAAARLGFVTDAADPRRFIAACIGSEGCASGRYAARRLARSAAARLAPLLDGSISLHLSGCGKGCAHPEAADFTLSGIDKGAGLVLDGRARDKASGFAAPETLIERLAELAGHISGAGGTARAGIDRLGAAAVMRVMVKEAAADNGGEPGPSEGRRLSA